MQQSGSQVPNREAVDVIEASGLNYTVLCPGYLKDGDENDMYLPEKVKRQEAILQPSLLLSSLQ